MNKNGSHCARGMLAPVVFAIAAVPVAAEEQGEAGPASPVVVTATRVEQPSFDLPAAIDSVDRQAIQGEGKLEVNVSEVLNRVPGTVVQNRDSYAQEQQIIIRGFGARSSFGTRGVKLLADGIPASTPDGQGGPGLMDLSSARRIEVLRGPFSALYGNHSGGVVQVFTEDGPPEPSLGASAMAGSWNTWKAGLKFGGTKNGLNAIGSASRFATQGYREHSAAQKDQFNAKLAYAAAPGSRLSFVFNYLDQPQNEDPLGLTQEQLEEDPGQAGTNAVAFDTRRSLTNTQGGVVFETAVSEQDTLRGIAYLGVRDNVGYLAIPMATQRAVTQSGGVPVLDRQYGGLGLRWTRRTELGGMPLTVTSGAEYDRAAEDRKGYLNEFGTATLLKRDEDNAVDSWGAYLQGELVLSDRLSASAGLRFTSVRFESQDNFICTIGDALCPGGGITTPVAGRTTNPDDSGSVTHDAWTPVAGLLYKLTPALNVYANAGQSFETPTFIELAYQADPAATGPNLGLRPALSDHYEIGAKAYLSASTRLDVALFRIDTQDEIVVESNSGGRQSYQNAGDTQRTGVEVALTSELGRGFALYLAATYLDAVFKDQFQTCPSPAPAGPPCATRVTVDPGNTIPGVPPYTVFADLSYRYAPMGFTAGVEVRAQGKVYVNDTNSQAADDFTVVNLRAGFEQRAGRWHLTESVRVDNVFDKHYVGGVIVNDSGGRYYAPAPTSTVMVGVTAAYAF